MDSKKIKWVMKDFSETDIIYKSIFQNCFGRKLRRDREAREIVLSAIKKVYKYDTRLVESPIWAGFKLTNICNLNCIHCWANNQNYKPDKNQIMRAIDNLKQMQVFFVGLSGGEIFTREDIFEILSYIKSKGMYIELFTNATLLTCDKVDKLEKILDKDFDIIQISLDGATEQTFARQRGTKSFNHIIDIIKELKKKGFKIRISYVATHENVDELFETYKLISDLNVDGFSVSPVYPKNKGVKLHEFLNMDKYYEEIHKCLQFNSDMEFVYFLQIDFFQKIDGLVESLNIKSRIPYLLDPGSVSLYIDANGDIFPEFELDSPDFYMGNIYNDTVEQILDSCKSNKLSQGRDLRGTKCEACKFMPLCLPHSYEQAYEFYKDINKPNPFCKLLEE